MRRSGCGIGGEDRFDNVFLLGVPGMGAGQLAKGGLESGSMRGAVCVPVFSVPG